MSGEKHYTCDEAAAVWRRIAARIGDPASSCEVVGSVRRRVPMVGDIEVIAPLPDSPYGPDPLHQRLRALCSNVDRGNSLFEQPEPVRPLLSVKGLHTAFHYAQFSVAIGPRAPLNIDVFRYRPVPKPVAPFGLDMTTNYGWIKVLRTGPADFGVRVLSSIKSRFPDGYRHHPASVDGFLCDHLGQKISTPDEQSVFDIAGMPYVEPHERFA